MIALAASMPVGPARRRRPVRPSRRRISSRRAARRSRRSRRGRPRPACSRRPWRRSSAVSLVAARPVLPVKALALPELTTSARAVPALELRAAPVDRRRRAFRVGEHAGDRRAGIEQRQQHVGAAGVADAGGGGREPHAGDRRHVGKLRRREREMAVVMADPPLSCPATAPGIQVVQSMPGADIKARRWRGINSRVFARIGLRRVGCAGT